MKSKFNLNKNDLKNKTVVITYGTYDLFHEGHENILKKASEQGEVLIVAVSTDEFNSIKGKKSIQSYEERINEISKKEYVDFVIPEKSWDQKSRDVLDYSVDKLVMGSDWSGEFDELKKQGVQIKIFDRTAGISSTMLRRNIRNNN